ncbi:MAG: NAD(P)/FAD-dependent oxidoreductase [Flavobacteriales bacterium]|nr:NAD(P)/FAD-dependent oxidoreductase [Flavobacteriales bacterium]
MEIGLPNTTKKRVLIIGAGFGGIQLAKELKNSPFQVVLIDKNNFHCFQPLMYQVATSRLDAESVIHPIRNIFRKQKNFCFRMAEIQEIVPGENKIRFGKRVITYDYLVVATGAKTNFRKNEGLIVSAMPMKSINEALELRSLILQNFENALLINNERKRQGLLNFVIAGAGPTGVELAGAIGELKQKVLPKDYPSIDFTKMNIYLVQSRERVLPALSEKSSKAVKTYLERLGVTIVFNTRVLDFFGDYVTTSKDDIIARTLIWTAGVEGAPLPGLNKDCSAPGNRIATNEYNKVVGYQNIFAIGDVAAIINEETPRGHPMVAPVAMQQAQLLAKNLVAINKGLTTKAFRYKNKGSMATVGKNKAVVEIGKIHLKGTFAWVVWMIVHLMSLVGFTSKFIALFHWVRDYFSNDRSMRTILTPFVLADAKRKRRQKIQDEIEH